MPPFLNPMIKAELLAPAGNFECMKAAVLNDADAVYFGGGAFNARRGAQNFTGDALREAIDYCRLRGVKTHITLNTLLFDGELAPALDFAAELFRLRADAVIVQDIGLAALIRRELPELCIHASTQMGVHSLDGLRYLEERGIARAVLAREMSLDDIRFLHENSPVELEFFCHGALCMGFSGSCLYSSMAGERSGNRGTCAQPCRKNACVFGRNAGRDEFALSTNDIAMLDELGALADAGVCSFKIEGRMKSPEYVATVTRIYRAALDGETPPGARGELFSIFNRGEFSTAHLHGDSVTTGHVGRAAPDRELIARAHESVRRERPAREAEAVLTHAVGEPIMLELTSGGCTARAVGPVCEPAKNPQDPEKLRAQTDRFGDTVFRLKDFSSAGEGFAPASVINALRREACAKLEQTMLAEPREKKPIDADTVKRHIEPCGPAETAPLRYVRVRSGSYECAGADLVGYDPVFPADAPGDIPCGRLGRVLILPNVIPGEDALEAYRRLLAEGMFQGVEVNNISHARIGLQLPVRIAGVGLNIMNSASATETLRLGFTHIMPSLELTRRQLAQLAEGFGARLIVPTYGRAPLMQLLHCPVREYRGCRRCRGKVGMLTDGEGRSFPLENVRFPNGRCLVRMLNTAVTDIRGAFRESGIPAYAEAVTPEGCEGAPVTRGHWSRAVD